MNRQSKEQVIGSIALSKILNLYPEVAGRMDCDLIENWDEESQQYLHYRVSDIKKYLSGAFRRGPRFSIYTLKGWNRKARLHWGGLGVKQATPAREMESDKTSPKTQPKPSELKSEPAGSMVDGPGNLCPKCGTTVMPLDQNCPFCKINLSFAREHPEIFIDKAQM